MTAGAWLARHGGRLRTAVTLGAFAAILLVIHPLDILRAFSDVAWAWVFARAAPFALGILMQAWRWQAFLQIEGIAVGTWLLFRRSWMSRFFAFSLPGSLGTDAFRIIESADYAGSRLAVARSVLLDRTIGMLGLLLYLSLAGLAWGIVLPLPALAWPSGAGALATLLATAWLGHPQSGRVGAALAGRLPAGLARRFAASLAGSLAVLGERRGVLVLATAWTLALNLVTAAGSWLGFKALGIDIGLWVVVALMPIVHLVAMLPISFNGLGLREGAFIGLFAAAGVPAASAAAVAILLNATGMLMNTGGGVLYLMERRRIAGPAP